MGKATTEEAGYLEKFQTAIIRSSLDAVVGLSVEGAIIIWNPAAERIFGHTSKEAIGKTMELIVPPEKLKESAEATENLLRGESIEEYETQRKTKDGNLIDVSLTSSAVKDENNNLIGFANIYHDITGRKKASEYARSLIEASLDPLVTISPEGKITDVNEATIKITGVPREKLIGTDFSNYFTESEKAKASYKEVFEKGEVRDYLLTIRNTTGKLINVLYNASLYKDDKGNVLGVFAAAREIGKAELKAAHARELARISKFVFRIIISNKVSKGTVKINEDDAIKIGVGLVDDVIIKPTKKEIADRKLVAMSLTAKTCPQDAVIINAGDANLLGLEEDDTVFINKTEAEEKPEFVEEETYESVKNDYDYDAQSFSPLQEKKTDTNKLKQMQDFEAKIDALRNKKL